jgi:hypothetical protein
VANQSLEKLGEASLMVGSLRNGRGSLLNALALIE